MDNPTGISIEGLTAIGVILSLIIAFISLIISYRSTHKTTFINSVTSARINWIENLRILMS